MELMLPDLARFLIPTVASFVIGMLITPIVSHYLYKFKAWKKRPGKLAMDGTVATEFNRLHEKNETRAPRMGGIVIWVSATLAVVFFSLLPSFFDSELILSLDFLSRNQTWLPLATLLIGAVVGFVDDWLVIQPHAEGLRLRTRILIVLFLSAYIGWWFYSKLDVSSINIPFYGELIIGLWVIPLFVLISLSLFASGVIDGIDGLSGGVFASIFSAYAMIAYSQTQYDLAAFCGAIVGGLLAFIWFNIPPARFYMSDTGTMALTLSIAAIAFTTDTLGGGYGIFVLPIIGAVLVVTVASNVIQIVGKRVFKVKVFRIAPLHHHFEAVGWPPYKVVMRYWIISILCAFFGVIVAIAALSY